MLFSIKVLCTSDLRVEVEVHIFNSYILSDEL